MAMTRPSLIMATLLLLALAGCSSLPRSPERVTALDTRAEAAYQAGLRQHHEGRHAQAAAYFERALAMHASVDDRAGTAEALASLGRARLALGEHDLATAAFQRARDASRGLQRPDLEATALGGLAAVALDQDRPDDARTWLDAALALPLQDPGPERAVLLHDLGIAHYRLGDPAVAETHLRAALSMHEAAGDHPGVATSCHALARLCAATDRLDEALDLALRALARDKASEHPRGVAADLTLLAELSERLGRTDDAIGYHRRAELAWTALGRADRAAAAAERIAALR
jgi:tetratricopeptide (TPR) repeat protein